MRKIGFDEGIGVYLLIAILGERWYHKQSFILKRMKERIMFF